MSRSFILEKNKAMALEERTCHLAVQAEKGEERGSSAGEMCWS